MSAFYLANLNKKVKAILYICVDKQIVTSQTIIHLTIFLFLYSNPQKESTKDKNNILSSLYQ